MELHTKLGVPASRERDGEWGMVLGSGEGEWGRAVWNGGMGSGEGQSGMGEWGVGKGMQVGKSRLFFL